MRNKDLNEMKEKISKLKKSIEILEFYRKHPKGYRIEQEIRFEPSVFSVRDVRELLIQFVFNNEISAARIPLDENINLVNEKSVKNERDYLFAELEFYDTGFKKTFYKNFLIDKENIKIIPFDDFLEEKENKHE